MPRGRKKKATTRTEKEMKDPAALAPGADIIPFVKPLKDSIISSVGPLPES